MTNQETVFSFQGQREREIMLVVFLVGLLTSFCFSMWHVFVCLRACTVSVDICVGLVVLWFVGFQS